MTDINLPKTYMPHMAPFHENGKATKRVLYGLENVLSVYSSYAKLYAKDTENNVSNYAVEKVFVVGSGARENKIESDLDLMLITPKLDDKTTSNLKTMLSYIFFNNRPKTEGIDVFVRAQDKFPERDSIEITSQVKTMLDKYNAKLK